MTNCLADSKGQAVYLLCEGKENAVLHLSAFGYRFIPFKPGPSAASTTG